MDAEPQADGDGSEWPTHTPYRAREPWEQGDPPWPEEDAGPEYRAYRAVADDEAAIEQVIAETQRVT
jgi:hypothetical protein